MTISITSSRMCFLIALFLFTVCAASMIEENALPQKPCLALKGRSGRNLPPLLRRTGQAGIPHTPAPVPNPVRQVFGMYLPGNIPPVRQV